MLSFTFIVFSINSNSNYSIGLQHLKPFTLRTVACTIWPKIGLGHET